MENTADKVYVGITTIPAIDQIEVGDPTFERYKSTYTDYKTFIKDKDLIQSYYEDAGKSVAFNRVLQIAVGFEHENTVRVSILKGDEGDIIEQFHSMLRSDYFKAAKLYGYNNEFLRDVLTFRARVNGISKDKEAIQLLDISNQPWNRKRSVDLMNEVVSSYRGKISLINCAHAAGIDYQGIVPGEDIQTYYQTSQFDVLDSSSAKYIQALINIRRFLDTEEYLTDMVVSIKEAEKVEPKEVNLMSHIAETGTLNKEQIRLLAESNEDPDHIVTLVTAALSNTIEKPQESNALQDLKDALYGKVDESDISVVVEKGNMGMTEVKKLIKEHSDKTAEKKTAILENLKQYLTNNGKIGQKRCSSALEILEKEWS